MQYADPFSTNDEDDFEEIPNMHESYSVSSYQSSVNSKRKKVRMMTDALNSQDKGYRKYSLVVNYKPVEIVAYSTSSTPGTKIRDAITGARDERFKVGSSDEDLYFKVRMAIGHVGSEKDENKAETTLFYDNPEQYERHMHAIVSPEHKEYWGEKRRRQLAKYQE
jgi:hypothetical protein